MNSRESSVYEEIDVLLVEDDPDDWEFTIRAAKKGNSNARCVRFANGEQALDYMQNTSGESSQSPQVKLILLDLDLPKMDGLEVLRRIRKSTLTRSTPVVVLSSTDSPSTIRKAYQLGANSYVIKPAHFEEYLEEIGSLVSYWSTINTRARAGPP